MSALERGDVFFFYRPKVGEEHVESLDDVQRLYLILEPEGDGPFRRIEVGRKKLPPAGWAGRRHGWAFVDAVTHRGEELGEATQREEYETKTRGRRVQPEDRPVGEGVYALVRHDDHVHLVFELELPRPPGEPQQALELGEGRDLLVEVKDPTKQAARRGPTSGRTEPLPDELQERFGDRSFIALDPPAFLDHEGVELLLMPAAGDDAVEVDLRPEREDADSAELFGDLGLAPDAVPTDPLLDREWQ